MLPLSAPGVQNDQVLIGWVPQVHVTARLIVMILALLVALPALADNRKDCIAANSERSDKACAAIIKAGRETKKVLAVAYTNRGNSYRKKGEYDLAIPDYDKAIALNPKYADAYSGRGAVYRNRGEYDRAITDLGKAISLNPKNSTAYNSRGLAYDSTGDRDRAIADYDKAISLDPKFAEAYGNRGSAHVKKGDYDPAIADLDQAINLDPELLTAYSNRGFAYIKKRDYDRAIADLIKTINLDPRLRVPHNNLGFAYASKGDYDRAIAEYNTAISLDPKYGAAYYNRGEAYEKKGQSEKALADLRQAIANMLSTDSESSKAQKLVAGIEQRIADAAAAAAKAKLAAEQAKAKAAPAHLAPPQAAPAPSKRVALVIGNSAYKYAAELPNPGNDSRAMGQLLAGMGFAVISGMDLKKAEFETKIMEFAKATKTAELSLFFYAGHGLQVAGQNYLVPVDAKVEDDSALNIELINVEAITSQMGGGKKAGVALLDASRDNPFVRSLARGQGAARGISVSQGLAALFGTAPAASVSQGLAAISPEGKGLVIGYAAAPGDIAADGEGINSPFTAALLKRLPTKGAALEQVLKQVKADVIEATHDQQHPWTNSGLSTEVYLLPAN